MPDLPPQPGLADVRTSYRNALVLFVLSQTFAQDFLRLFGGCEQFAFAAHRLGSLTYKAQLWGPDVKAALDPILEADWHTHEPRDNNAERSMTYVLCFTADCNYLDVCIRFVVRTFFSRHVTGPALRYQLGTLTFLFRAARSRRAPAVTSL